MKHSPLTRGTSTLKRSRLRPFSVKKAALNATKAPIREAVFRRDGGCVLQPMAWRTSMPECFGGPTPHHLRKEKQGGEYVESNLVTLCAGHNDWVESGQPTLAWEMGLVCRAGDTLSDCWQRMRMNGLRAQVQG